MNVGTLIIFSGLPGSGKSTLATRLASKLAATYLRIDTIEQGLRDLCGISEIEGKGYQLAHRLAQENLQLGNSVIADSVNPLGLTRSEWNRVAEEVGAPFINIEVICSDKREHQNRIETRSSPVPGLRMPTWEEVLSREYEPWNQKIFRIDTNGKSVERTFSDLIVALKSRLTIS